MSDIGNPVIENALQGNLVELSRRNEQTHLQIRTLNEMVVSLRDENAKLRELVLRFYKVTQTLRCHEVDDWYCRSECPLGTGKDGCTVTELADKAGELGVDVYE